MMFKCGDCEMLFDEPETVRESRGEFYGMPAYEDISICPYCGSEFIFIDGEECEDELGKD